MACSSLCHALALPAMPKQLFHPNPSFVFLKICFLGKKCDLAKQLTSSLGPATFIEMLFSATCVTSLQANKMTPKRAHIAAMTVTTLQALCFDGQFSAFWDLVIKAKEEFKVQDSELPRREEDAT